MDQPPLQPPPSAKPPSRREDALAVVQTLHQAGHVAYFAGGCVRDLLLGLEAQDYDVATDAPPKRVRELFANTQAVGAAFGVILVRRGRSVIEVATFRTESDYTDGRRPGKVQFTTAEEDARRRDFTINGLMYDPLTEQVIDHVGGRADLEARVLRAIGEPTERFAEDHLRLLRAVRFAARFDLRIEPATAAAISRHAAQIKRVSPERLAGELRLMLTPPSRTVAWKLLREFGLLAEIFRFLPEPAGPWAGGEPSIFTAVAPGEPISFGVALAAATMSYRSDSDPRALLQKAEAQVSERAMRQALRLSNDESEELVRTLTGLVPLLADELPGEAVCKRFLAQPTARGSGELLEALGSVGLYADRIAWLRRRLSELGQTPVAPDPLVSGDDLTAAGLAPGPMFRRILDAVYDAQLESRVRTKEEAMALAMELARK